MFTTIVKRDGREEPFDSRKIEQAMRKSFEDSEVDIREVELFKLRDEVISVAEDRLPGKTPTVEEIQDYVERVLIAHNFAETAKKYILYRAERTKQREIRQALIKDMFEISFADTKDSEIKRENANIDGSTSMGTMLKYGSSTAKYFNLTQVIPPEFSNAHMRGDIHIHDLDFYLLTLTCCQIDIKKLLARGFNTGHGSIRPPKGIRSYSALACIAIQSNQNDMHGGQSIPNFDFGMAPGVRVTFLRELRDAVMTWLEVNRTGDKEELQDAYDALTIELNKLYAAFIKNAKQSDSFITNPAVEKSVHKALWQQFWADEQGADGKTQGEAQIDRLWKFAEARALKKTERETYQAMEAFVHNLCSMHSRAGAQVPFSSINFGTDTSAEGRIVIRNILLATEAGLGDGETPIFPISIFKMKSGVNYNPEDPNYDLFQLACRVSAKRMFPNFENLDAPYNLQYYDPENYDTEVATMGCRTRVMGNINGPQTTSGRGNLSFTTINLPRIAILAQGDREKFFKLLDERLLLVKDQLLHRFEVQARRKVKNFPFLMGQGLWMDSERLGPEDEIRNIIKHGTLSIGFIGLAEALVVLTGCHHGESDTAQSLGLNIVKYIREFTDKMSEEYKLNFTTLGTPAEGLSGRFVEIDRKEFGVIPGVTDREYYTNSSHVPVYFDITAAKKIAIEAPYHAYENAGHICYVEMNGDPLQNLNGFETIVRFMHDQGVGYGAINHPIDRDPRCGYNGIIGNECPNCNRKETPEEPFARIRRITGYLVGTLDRFNGAKRAEERDRVKHQGIL